MINYYLKTKRFLITKIEKGKPANHPVYVEKSVLRQIWEFVLPYLIFITGLYIGSYF